ncbi:DnaJ-class molecular chaperone [Rhodothalassium salexigens DSM 2132]|uniref:DnaJ-class molecular chaperone n=1 Tax=Rhodothalassium salexigens DSM 2132 TaxID=1188247 RepID=A0A4R2PF66_RHOSA|nr:J domain-containing protein [Rhodothalassium salexigens]MBB4211773.1 DnaJ-class molecular chaperone [Rhodothalassium salexigens DSM 2132]MBK1639638.1 hypothetical protein [Rhodothalassium salexigens DSM 2132]TCP33929.1 DnaJ-class molecular chaperone [Rhodothalassium salexigens DSM 2132]
MTKNLYQILGVDRSASEAEIKSAYRKLAKELHPDRNPGDQKIADRFKEVSSAYAILGDKEKRPKYDRGEIDEQGQERAAAGFGARSRGPYGGAAGFGGAGARGFGGDDFRGFAGGTYDETVGGEDVEDLFADLFGFSRGRTQQNRAKQPQKGADQTYRLSVSFSDAARGGTKRVTLTTGRTLDVRIPAGVTDGQTIRLTGQGRPGRDGGPAGDALVRVEVAEHPYFTRDDKDVYLDLPIRVDEAVRGAKIKVPTLDGPVTITVPKGSSSGRKLRLKGKGVGGEGERGDQYVVLKIVLPDTPDPALEEAIEDWARHHSYPVRDHLKL